MADTERIEPLRVAQTTSPLDRFGAWMELCGIVLIGMFLVSNLLRLFGPIWADLAAGVTVVGIAVQLWRINSLR